MSKLFASRTETIRKATRPIRKPRLGLEALEDRTLLSASSVLSNGVLTITADNNGSYASFLNMSGDAGDLWLVSNGANFQYFNGAIKQVVFKGGAGSDTFSNSSNVDSLVIGSAGNDFYQGGSGVNLLDRNGHRVNWSSTSGQNFTYGLGDSTPTSADRAATGAMAASLSQDATQLTLAGPSGIGFRLDVTGGQWQHATGTRGGLITHAFSLSSTSASVKLHTGSILGDIPLPAAALVGMKITAKGTAWSDPVGEFEQIGFGPGGILPLNTRDPLSQFAALGSDYGLDLQLPSTNWGLKLGSDLLAPGGPMNGAPLDGAVPYFYVAINRSLTASFGDFEASVGGQNIQVAFDPSDPMVYASIGDYAIGVSVNGAIPYTPQVAFTGPVFGANVLDPNISGNVYIAGSIPIGDTPLTIKGNMVIDLIKDINGKLSGMNRTTGNALLKGTQDLMALTSAMNAKPRIGINGQLDVGVEVGVVSLGTKVGEASAFYMPVFPADSSGPANSSIPALNSISQIATGRPAYLFPTFATGPVFAVVAKSTNPWASVPVVGDTISKIMPAASFLLNGMVDSQNNWGVHVTAQSGKFFGFTPDSLSIDASSVMKTLHFKAQIHPGFGLANTAEGDLNISTGQFSAKVSTGFNFDIIGLATVKGSVALSLGYTGGPSGDLSAKINIDASAPPLVKFTASGSLVVRAGAAAGPLAAGAGGSLEVFSMPVIGVSLSTSSASVTFLGKTSTFTWSTKPEGTLDSDGPVLVGHPASVHFFVPEGEPDSLHFSAALSKDDLAADYAAAGADPMASFTFSAAGAYPIYGRMYLADGEVSDYDTTVTVYASGQGDVYFVARLYHDLLGRTGEPEGLAYHTGALAHGTSKEGVVQGFLHSLEYLQNTVQAAYQDLLGRYAEPEGLGWGVSYLQSGGATGGLRGLILNSPEYAARRGDDFGFVAGMYKDVLGRTPAPKEVDYYTSLLTGTASRADVVAAFFASDEHQTKLTEDTYQKFLRHDADAAGLWFNTKALRHGASEFDLMAGVLASGEYAATT